MPFYRFHVETPLPETAVLDRIRELIRPGRGFREWVAWNITREDVSTGPPFLGKVNRDTFRLHRDIRYRNSFLPRIWGRILPGRTGSRVTVNMFIHPFAILFMIVWFGGLGYGVMQLWVHRKEAVPYAVLVPTAMILFGVALVLVCFIPEAAKAKRLLESALKK